MASRRSDTKKNKSRNNSDTGRSNELRKRTVTPRSMRRASHRAENTGKPPKNGHMIGIGKQKYKREEDTYLRKSGKNKQKDQSRKSA
jgi:hypothetical protein